MPIVNLSDQQTRMNNTLSFPMWGRFRKGDEKPERGVGRNLDYFRIDWDDLQAQTAFESMFGTEPRKLMIATVGHTVDAVFDSWYRLYSGNNALKIKCDGHTIHKAADVNLVGKNCTCNPENRQCSEQGYLYFTIPALCEKLGYVGQFMLGTGSFIEIAEFAATLEAVFQTRGTLNFAPFIMQRQNRTFDKTDDQGRPVRYTQSMVQLVPPIEAIFAPTQNALPSGGNQSEPPQLTEGSQGHDPEPVPEQPNTNEGYDKLFNYFSLATGFSLVELFNRFAETFPEESANPLDKFNELGIESFIHYVLVRMSDEGIGIRLNQFVWDGKNNRHFVNVFLPSIKILMFSRDELRKAGAKDSLINALDKKPLNLMKQMSYKLEELPFAYIDVTEDENGSIKYYSIRSIRFPETENEPPLPDLDFFNANADGGYAPEN